MLRSVLGFEAWYVEPLPSSGSVVPTIAPELSRCVTGYKPATVLSSSPLSACCIRQLESARTQRCSADSACPLGPYAPCLCHVACEHGCFYSSWPGGLR